MLSKIPCQIMLGLILIPAVGGRSGAQLPPSASKRVSAPLRSANFSEAFVAYELMPRWNHGFLTKWTRQNLPSDITENVSVFDSQGKLVAKTRISLPDASATYIDNVVAGPGGRIAAVGWGVNQSGEMASFLADVTLATRKVRIIQLSPFYGGDVTFGPDGTLWVVGNHLGPAGRSLTEDSFMVEHFGIDDTLIGSHVLRSSLQCGQYNSLSFPGATPSILATKDRIGIIMRSCRAWIELDKTGQLVGQWNWKKAPSDVEITNVAFTSSNELYAHASTESTNWLCYFDKKASEWMPISTELVSSQNVRFSTLMGSDDDKLVYKSGETELSWSTPSQ